EENSEESPRLMMNQTCSTSNDQFGYGIFNIFDRKYRQADKIFQRAGDKILSLHKQKRLTKNGLAKLTNVLDLYSEIYEKFVADVQTKRVYTPKASSGGKAIAIKTPQDWAEATIELVDLVNKFHQALEDNIKGVTNTENLEKECKSDANCDYPCTKKKGLFGKKTTCSYK
ncbi:MAG: hypothetical protein ACMG6E_08840, partial [Candidatus Roizmanbacteria bacterium]